MNIPFSPPHITEKSVELVSEVLRSGWITTGPKVKEFENKLTEYIGSNGTVVMSSATAALEMSLRILGVGPGDEVITSAYTYTASASVIDHVGAKIVLVDTDENLGLNIQQLEEKINENTKAIIPVDIAGRINDYAKIKEIVKKKKELFKSNNEIANNIGRIAIIADAAHSFGAQKNEKQSGMFADFTCYSFHAVKNLTTAEGGAVTWIINDKSIEKKFKQMILHGQSKDAFSKMQKGNWEYDITTLGYKSNMTDIQAAIGITQLSEYNENLKRRHEIIKFYESELNPQYIKSLNHNGKDFTSSGHLYITWVKNASEEQRNKIINELAKVGVSTNVHYKPLPLHTAYINYGFDISNFPMAHKMYKNEITLPLYPQLTNEEIRYIVDKYNEICEEVL
ncbi:DegT/DnrJ/EryC1/StrS family aminotransferase [Staphylococcus haemolyticus]|uniref:DegT/DnrJ/EryC1/StrS family aminotransferase n=1 Tax=Staphylococcus haemolyticus TaxID=1283 RepID=UPI001F0BEEBE|nr:DegT/DnrJ/EryC1/StrS family aminotransferase [Staphylococcus haemolyticus]MCH4381997.1 DegT/DnrJ/EryC1/StrS family aminotransferase [Staphylococcus haemolyticus]